MKPVRFWSRLRNDEGAIAPLAAMTLAGMIGLAGLVTDIGVWYVQRGNLQQATDAAALGAVSWLGNSVEPAPPAASQPANPPTSLADAANKGMANNGYGGANVVSVEPGYYCQDSTLAPSARFSLSACALGDAAATAPNAVRLTTKTTGPALLTKVLGGSGRSIQTTAIAARVDEAGLSVASGLATVDLNIANATLQSLLGSSGLSLSAVQFDGLLSTNMVAKSFLDALAATAGVSGGTYGQLLQNQVKVADVVQTAIDTLNAQPGDTSNAVSALQAVKAKITGNTVISIGQLFDLGIWRDQPVAGSNGPAALGAGINVYQLLTFALQLGGASHAVSVPATGLGIPGVVGITLQATAIEPPQSAYFAFGPKGISVHTAQVRVQLALQLLAPLIQLPLYVEVAHGDATISDIGCGTDPANDGWVKVAAKTGVASVYIGAPSGSINNFSTPVTVQAAPLLNVLGVVVVGGSAQVTAGSSTATTLTFTQPPSTGVPAGTSLGAQGYIARLISTDGGPTSSSGFPAQVVSNDILTGVGDGLWNSLSNATLKLCLASVCNSGLSFVATLALPAVLITLKPIISAIDPLIDGLLEALGVKLGTTEVQVTGLRCGVPVLVG